MAREIEIYLTGMTYSGDSVGSDLTFSLSIDGKLTTIEKHTDHGNPYLHISKLAITWFRIRTPGRYFFHFGRLSDGCVTIHADDNPIGTWEEISGIDSGACPGRFQLRWIYQDNGLRRPDEAQVYDNAVPGLRFLFV